MQHFCVFWPTIGTWRIALEAKLLSDAERREDRAEQIIARILAGNFAELVLRAAQLLGGEFAGACDGQVHVGALQMFGDVCQCVDMTATCAERTVRALAATGQLRQFDTQQIEARAGMCRQPNVGRAIGAGKPCPCRVG